MSMKEKLLDVLSAAVSGPPPDPAAATIKAVIGSKTICSPEDRKKLIELDRQYGQAYETVLKSSYPDAKAGFALHQKAQEAAIAAGNFDIDYFNIQDYITDYQERQQAGKRRMMILSQQAAVLSRPICSKVASILTEQADAIDQADREKYENFVVPFTSSQLANRLRALAATVMQRVSSGGGSRPSHYCGYLL